MSVPLKSCVELLELTVADCKTIDQDVLVWILAQTLPVVVDRCINSAPERVFKALLLPKLNTIHVLDEIVELQRIHFKLGHTELHILSCFMWFFI